MKRAWLLAPLCLAGCATTQIPEGLLSASPEAAAHRQAETRRYDGIGEGDLLAAAANVLQDLGFSLENSESRLGVLTASKQRSALDAGEIVLTILTALLRAPVPYGQDQTIRVAVVVRPVADSAGRAIDGSHFVRLTIQRTIRLSNNSTRGETLQDPSLHAGFFERLSKSVFLEAQKL